tara:strand:+ start:1044 stop:2147 length:1104 start_codon:yes stop_codon:yes gene_type:complete
MRALGVLLSLCIITIPITGAVPIVEVFVDENTPSVEVIPESVFSGVLNEEMELVIWYTDSNHSLHISAANERAEDLNAKNGDIFIQGIYWNKSSENIPNHLESIHLEMDVKQNNDGSVTLEAKNTLENELEQTVVLQWLLLKKIVPVSEHPIGPTESNVVCYHAWDSNINRTKGAENQWIHQIEKETMTSWNIGDEDLIAVASLISLDSKEIHGAGSSEIIFQPVEENGKNIAISMILVFSGIIGSILVIQSERKRQQDMPIIRPLIMNKSKKGDEFTEYFIEITTKNAAIREITIEGNGFWRCSNHEIPQEISPKTSKKIKIRKTEKGGEITPCTIRLEVDGHERWILDVVFPESNLDKKKDAEES